MVRSWSELAERPEFDGLKAFVDRQVRRAFQAVPPEATDRSGTPKGIGRVLTLGMGLFILLFASTFLLLPGNWIGDTLRFVLFFPLFFASFAMAIILNGRPLLAFLLRGQTRYTARARALDAIARRAGLAYVPRPGGEHPALEWLAERAWLPADLSRALDGLPKSDISMAHAVEAARAARIMGRAPIMIGSDEQKARHAARALQLMSVEDGFHGERDGMSFDAFEWIEREEDAPDTHHLIIVLKAPRAVQGITELRARSLPWLDFRDQASLEAVDLGPKAFHDRYRLRASDQVEARAIFDPAVVERLLAMAHDGPFRAVARGEHLVFDLEGEDRFALIDPATGAWSDETIRKGLTDLAEMLDLVDALAQTFRVKRAGG